MIATKTVKPETQITTGVVRLSYAHIWEPWVSKPGDEPKYSCSLIIRKDDEKTLAKITAAVEAAKLAGIKKYGGKIPPKLKLPLRDGDEERPGDEAYEGCYFLNANAKECPKIVDYPGCQEIIDKTEVYSGCYIRASVSFYAFSVNGNSGVAVGLNHIQKVRDGESLGGRAGIGNAFDEELDDDLLLDDDLI
ncbi:MAG: DUF2815 family protein [Defluviitaleaceae bacterium]|nr:DUF2815 family protein [Defluviitaleaceae bacterium]MCL2837387.1 DUF2815 family protein [Defluviitaleaceae bacterium]